MLSHTRRMREGDQLAVPTRLFDPVAVASFGREHHRVAHQAIPPAEVRLMCREDLGLSWYHRWDGRERRDRHPACDADDEKEADEEADEDDDDEREAEPWTLVLFIRVNDCHGVPTTGAEAADLEEGERDRVQGTGACPPRVLDRCPMWGEGPCGCASVHLHHLALGLPATPRLPVRRPFLVHHQGFD